MNTTKTSRTTGEMNKERVLKAVDAMFARRDLDAIDTFVDAKYLEHDPMVSGGREGLRTLLRDMGPEVRYEPIRVLADGDMVALQGRVSGCCPEPYVTMDLYRLAKGRIIEHWAAAQPEVSKTVSGHGMLDGPTEISEPQQTEANRRLTEDFIRTVMVDGQTQKLGEYVDPKTYIEHDPERPDGLTGLRGFYDDMAQRDERITYDRVDHVVADGDYVLVHADGAHAGKPHEFWDLFRLGKGRIVEHWDVRRQLGDETCAGQVCPSTCMGETAIDL